ncbi:MAG: tetratricopeptide repeat protein [Candidatus Obscuribacterales bacterium]|nr:tetratricopeptide repeat protein [Candidatus Obscuribacterales bacterium]
MFEGRFFTLALLLVLNTSAQAAPQESFFGAKSELTENELNELSKYVESHAKEPDAHRRLAKAYGQVGMPGLASDELVVAWRLDPANIFDLTAALHYYQFNNETEKSNALIAEALSQYQNNDNMLDALGQFFLRERDNKNAERFLQAAQKHNPNNPLTLTLLAQALLNSGKYQEALNVTKSLAESKTTQSPAFYLRGKALSALGQNTAACQSFAKSFAMNPHVPEVANAYFNSLLVNDKYNEALPVGLHALYLACRRLEDSSSIKHSLLIVLSHINWPAAEKTIEQTSQASRSAYYCFSLGDLLDKFGKPNAAMKQYAQGLSFNPTYGRAYMRMGKEMEKNEQYWGEALQLYARAYNFAPNDPQVEAIYRRFFQRFPNKDRDLALKLKSLIKAYWNRG